MSSFLLIGALGVLEAVRFVIGLRGDGFGIPRVALELMYVVPYLISSKLKDDSFFPDCSAKKFGSVWRNDVYYYVGKFVDFIREVSDSFFTFGNWQIVSNFSGMCHCNL